MSRERLMSSEYMHWVKTASQARYDLVSSDLLHCPLSELKVTLADLEINGPGGYGYQPLREALARKCGVTPDCIVSSLGTSMANHIAFAALIQPGDEVLLEHPTYELLLSTLRYLGASVRRFHRRPENGFLIDTDELTPLVTSKTKLIVLTNLHNPSSAFTDEGTLRRVSELASAAGAHLLVDEVYADAAFGERPRSAFHAGSNVVATNSLTKVYGLSGLRCGWIVASPPLAARMWRLTDLFHSTPAHMAELVSVIALRELDRLAARSQSLLAANTTLVNEFFTSCKALTAVTHRYGLVAFPKLNRGSVDSLCSLLRKEYATSVAPGKFFEMPEYFRIGIGRETSMLAEALPRLKSALEEVGGKG